jgi:tight adherence protein C
MDPTLLLVAGIGLAAVASLAFGARAMQVHGHALERLESEGTETPTARRSDAALTGSWMRRWLALAGFRRDAALPIFLSATAACGAVAIVVAVALEKYVIQTAVAQLAEWPGGVGEALATVLQAGPWIVFATVAAGPMLIVRARRHRLVREVERDLPIVLELFATLAQAGLGFDAGLARIVASTPQTRPLISEFIGFQRDLLAGVPRVQALRHLAQRLDVTTITGFISAIVQAEQVGASVSDTLRQQANDLRDRRREQALLLAQSLPVKLFVPLVICFLPSIFVSTLAPVLYQMLQISNTLFRGPGQ